MPAFNQSLDRFAEETRDLLLPGERLLALESAQAASGTSRIEHDRILGIPMPDRDPNDPPGPGDRAAAAAVDFLLVGPAIDDRHLLGGITGTGSSTSTAAAIDRESVKLNTLIVTDRRLLFASAVGRDYEVLVGIDRAALVSAGANPTFGQRGRIELAFADGSTTSIMAGMLIRKASRRLLAALGGQARA